MQKVKHACRPTLAHREGGTHASPDLVQIRHIHTAHSARQEDCASASLVQVLVSLGAEVAGVYLTG